MTFTRIRTRDLSSESRRSYPLGHGNSTPREHSGEYLRLSHALPTSQNMLLQGFGDDGNQVSDQVAAQTNEETHSNFEITKETQRKEKAIGTEVDNTVKTDESEDKQIRYPQRIRKTSDRLQF